jgi:hypothetical protein
VISHVAVDQYQNGIDVVFFLPSGFTYNEFKSIKNDAVSLVYELAKMAGVKERLSIYP